MKLTFQEEGSHREIENPYSLRVLLETSPGRTILIGTYSQSDSDLSRKQIIDDTVRLAREYSSGSCPITISPLGHPNLLLHSGILASELSRMLSSQGFPASLEFVDIDRR